MKQSLSNYIVLACVAAFLLISVGFGFYHVNSAHRQLAAHVEGLSCTPESCTPSEKVIEKIVTKTVEPWADVVKRLNNTVVQVFNQKTEYNWLEPFKAPRQGESFGSGFFISDDGHLITNAHVVEEAHALYIQLPALGKERLQADLVGISFDRDLALLKVREEGVAQITQVLGSIPFLKLGDSGAIDRADEVLAVGYPLGEIGQHLKITRGVVSGVEEALGRHLIQIDAAINPGNSGGPAINLNGEVIGINTYGIKMEGQDIQNTAYLIPINELKVILDALYTTPSKLVRKPYLGLMFNMGSSALTRFLGNPQPGGPYVNRVVPGGLVDRAGLKEGDMIYAIDDIPIDIYGDIRLSASDDKIPLIDYITYTKIGSKIKLDVYRKGVPMTLNVTFDESAKLPVIRTRYPGFEPIDYSIVGGMVVQEMSRNITPELIQSAPDLIMYEESKNQSKPVLIITSVLQDSVAQRGRVIRRAMRLDEVNGQKVGTVPEFNEALKRSLIDGYLRVKTKDGSFAVFPIGQILDDEPRMAAIYRYQPSPVVQEMLVLKQKYDEKQKKA